MTHTCPRCAFIFDDAIEAAVAPLAPEPETTIEAPVAVVEEQENTGKPTVIGENPT